VYDTESGEVRSREETIFPRNPEIAEGIGVRLIATSTHLKPQRSQRNAEVRIGKNEFSVGEYDHVIEVLEI